MANLHYNDYSGQMDFVNPYQQEYNDTCAIKSQQIILNEFGVPVSEDELVVDSIVNGWYNGHGTAPEDVGKLLVEKGIPCTRTEDANVYDLVNELAQGHKVIVAVDSGELWNNGILDWMKDFFWGDTPDHAIIVAGIDMSDPNNPTVIITDPGTGHSAQPYPLDQFMNAWADSHNFMVSTDIPTPTAVEQFTANDMEDMHLPEVAGVDYSTFQEFQAYSHMIDPSLLSNLNHAFQVYPTMPDQDFNSLLNMSSLPYFDLSAFAPTPMTVNPVAFDYLGLQDPCSIDPIETSSIDTGITDHSLELYTDLHQDALDHAQRCLDDGMYITAQMWQQQANELQDDINNINLDGQDFSDCI